MNDKTRGSRRLRRVWPLRAGILALMAGTLMLSAACSSSGSSSSSNSTVGTSAYYRAALAYAQCVRAHGVPNFPDPNSQGVFAVKNNDTHAEESQLHSAENTCKHLLPNGGQETQGQQQQTRTKLVQFAQCMRSHGLPNFPDPTSTGTLNFAGSGIKPNTPQFQSAMQACRSLLPQLGGTAS
jgi:hypothetical protein